MKKVTEQTKRLLAISFLKGVGPASVRSVTAIDDFEFSSIASIAEKVPRIGSAVAGSPDAWDKAWEKASEQVELAEQDGATILSVMDTDYPSLLRATKDDPAILYVKGNLAPSSNNSVALIGTRDPTLHGTLIAERITEFFVGNHWSIVSGLALGCDTVVHESAIKSKGHTIAVLAHGLHTVAPRQNKALSQAILDHGGALVTEYPYGQDATPHQFVKRDKIQAGIADGVVMVQSDLEGGSLHASRAAISYGRWLAVPAPTPKDLERQESKIQANALIAHGHWEKVLELLHCDDSARDLVKVIRSRDDYPGLLQAVDRGATKSPSEQDSLF